MVAVGRRPVGRRGADAYVCVAVGPDQFVAVAGRLPVGFRAGESGRPHIDVERRRRVVDHDDFLHPVIVDVVNHRRRAYAFGRSKAHSPCDFCVVARHDVQVARSGTVGDFT